MKKLAVVLIFLFTSSVFAQQQSDDLQKVKDALVIQILQTQDLQKQNQNLINTLQRIGDELKAVKTMEQLDSLKILYGLVDKKKDAKK